MPFELPPLPYDVAALEPYLTRENMELHHDKHHQAYVTNLNKFIEQGKADGSKSLEEITLASEGPVFNNAAQVWNHTFFWSCMKPGGGGPPDGELAKAIERDFGSLDQFKQQFADAAVSQFGSGWAWLVVDAGKLRVTKTGNADLPMKHGQITLLTCDVWEHAYYPTYKNVRPKYVETFLNNLINWSFVAENLAAAKTASKA
ncbi:MAG: superoxide dismutase [Acidobacteria bacterium]|nr:MAG: superoxide dismutase [Acidobacteriota bacterium]